jgi:hypothetical protein
MVVMGFDSGLGATYTGPAMRKRWILGWSLVLTLGVLPTSATAQDGEGGGEAGAPAAAAAKRQDELTAEQRKQLRVGKVDASKVPVEEKKTTTEAMLGAQRGAVARGTELLSEARGRNDILQLNCVNEKLTQLKGLLKLSEGASAAMYEGIATGTQDEINHQYTKIVVAHQKSASLKAEAEQCVGETSVFSGETEVEVEIDSDIPQADPTLPILPPPGPVVANPASKFEYEF